MPFKSDAQRKFLYKNHPEIARRWQAETRGPLPARVHKKKRSALLDRIKRHLQV